MAATTHNVIWAPKHPATTIASVPAIRRALAALRADMSIKKDKLQQRVEAVRLMLQLANESEATQPNFAAEMRFMACRID